jgi:redox-sensitive bicupin YhaK (pirin superfamily)
MKTNIHRSEERGRGDHGWLKSSFSYSFADYYNPERMGFGALRVVNDDDIAKGSGFPMHPHANMEIVTVVLEGELEHKDSMGNGSVISAGEVQRMSAGRGIRHSEWNPSETNSVKLFQIWIHTRDKDITPEYDQTAVDYQGRKGELITLVSGDADEEGMTFHQDAWMKRGIISEKTEYKLHDKANGLFIIIVKGSAEAAGELLNERDNIEITEADSVTISPKGEADILLIEVPL